MPFLNSRQRHPRRGSVLLVGLMFAGILAVSLASYVQLAKHSLQLSQRTLWANAAMNLAENGLEEAMHSLSRRVTEPAYSWEHAGWTIDGDDTDDEAWRKWTNLPVDGAARGEIRVIVYNYLGEQPNIVAVGTVVPPVGNGSPKVEKWLQISARRAARFASGLVARQSIIFNGASAKVDSWISKPTSSVTQAYRQDLARDQASIGSTSVAVNAVSVNNARIWGYVATGGAPPQIGPQGSIGDRFSGPGFVDPTRVSTHFLANFDAGFNPRNITSDPAFKAGTTLAEMGAGGKWIMEKLSLPEGTVWNITGNVELYLNTQSSNATTIRNAIDIPGSSGISVASNARLIVYTVGDVRLSGQGVINGGSTGATAGNPASFQLYGQSTATGTPQKIEILGNAAFSGTIYAPNAAVTFSGGGTSDRDILGSVVANTITLNGRIAFHQDESLAALTNKHAYFRPTRWNELVTEDERREYRSDIEDI